MMGWPYNDGIVAPDLYQPREIDIAFGLIVHGSLKDVQARGTEILNFQHDQRTLN